MAEFSEAHTTAQIALAARLDPGSYRIRVRLAQAYAERGDCAKVRDAAGAAHDLYPDAPEPRRLLRNCGIRVRLRGGARRM